MITVLTRTIARVDALLMAGTAAALLVSTPALSDRPTPSASSGHEPDALPATGVCGDDIRSWEQLPDGVNALTSQDDVSYPFQAEVADDFAGSADHVDGIGWWGAFDQGAPAPIDRFRIRIYSTTTDTLPEDLLFEQDLDTFQELGGDPLGYCVDFSEPFVKVPDTTYWISVVAVLAFPPQWGWSTGVGNGVGVAVRSDLFNLPDWVRGLELYDEIYDTAFFLYVTQTPVAEATWGTIKSHYRPGSE